MDNLFKAMDSDSGPKLYAVESNGEGVVRDASERELLQDFGYTESYERVLKGFGSFALVVSIASPMGAILIISAYQIVYGGYWGLTWGWIIPCFLFFPQALAVAELCSAMPVNGSYYWWTAALAPPKWSKPLSFIAGCSTLIQIITSLASFSFACATSFAAVIPMFGVNWVASNAAVMGIAMAIVTMWAAATFLHMDKVSWAFITSCLVMFVTTLVYLIALPVTHSVQDLKFADAADVFGSYQNFSGWGDAVAVPYTFFAVAWVVTGWSSPSYVAEETHNARQTAPRAILSSYATTAALGAIVCIISAFCIEDMEAAAQDPTGLPLYTMLANHWGPKITGAFILINNITTTLGGAGYLLSVASQTAAFARDGGLPFPHIFCRINPKTNMPLYSILLLVAGTFLMLLFGLSVMARTIIFSLAVMANLITMSLPISMRLFAGERFVQGPFSYGRLSKPIHACALLSTSWLVIMESFPASAEWTVATFNFNWVVTLAAFTVAIIAWFTFGKRNYKGLDLDAIAAWRRAAGDE